MNSSTTPPDISGGHRLPLACPSPRARVTDAVSSMPYSQWAAPLRLAVLYGLRRSELLGLRWSTVNLKA